MEQQADAPERVKESPVTEEQKEAKRLAANKRARERAAERRRVAAGLRVDWHYIGAGENELTAMLRDAGLVIAQQHRVNRYRIDLACWPVAGHVPLGGGVLLRAGQRSWIMP